MKKEKLTHEEYMNRIYDQITDMINANKISLAKKIINDCLERFPNSGILKRQLIICLLKEKNYEEALIQLEESPEENVFLQLITLYIKLGGYEERIFELYQKYFQNPKKELYEYLRKDKKSYQALEVYLKTKYDPNYKLSPSAEKNHTLRQLHHYNEEEVIDFIESTYHQGNKSKKNRFFMNQIDIKDLFYKSKKYISNHLEEGDIYKKLYEKYYFYYPYCGKETNGEYINNFAVYTIIGTSNIISIIPLNIDKNIDTISFENIDNLDNKEQKPLTKTLKPKTGLERFNQKYGINKINNN